VLIANPSDLPELPKEVIDENPRGTSPNVARVLNEALTPPVPFKGVGQAQVPETVRFGADCVKSESEIANATNEELIASIKETAGSNPLYYKLSAEVARRAEERKKQSVAAELEKPFNPRADVSADAKYLWKNIFIWFWVVPVVLGIIVYIITQVPK
jgi:hypothetical protein